MIDCFKSIRSFYDNEVLEALSQVKDYYLIKAVLAYVFPELPSDEHTVKLLVYQIVTDLQVYIMLRVAVKAMEKAIPEFIYDGLDQLNPEQAYVFISDHRDVILDTSLLDVALGRHRLPITTLAMGDSLIRKKHLKILAMLSRNIIIYCSPSPREALEHSHSVPEYTHHCINDEK